MNNDPYDIFGVGLWQDAQKEAKLRYGEQKRPIFLRNARRILNEMKKRAKSTEEKRIVKRKDSLLLRLENKIKQIKKDDEKFRKLEEQGRLPQAKKVLTERERLLKEVQDDIYRFGREDDDDFEEEELYDIPESSIPEYLGQEYDISEFDIPPYQGIEEPEEELIPSYFYPEESEEGIPMAPPIPPEDPRELLIKMQNLVKKIDRKERQIKRLSKKEKEDRQFIKKKIQEIRRGMTPKQYDNAIKDLRRRLEYCELSKKIKLCSQGDISYLSPSMGMMQMQPIPMQSLPIQQSIKIPISSEPAKKFTSVKTDFTNKNLPISESFKKKDLYVAPPRKKVVAPSGLEEFFGNVSKGVAEAEAAIKAEKEAKKAAEEQAKKMAGEGIYMDEYDGSGCDFVDYYLRNY